MSSIPILSGKDIVKKLEHYGYLVIRQKGSHIRPRHSDSNFKMITVPNHKTVKPGFLYRIIKDANLTLEEFINL